MHIALVCNEYPPARQGGIGTFTHTLAEGAVAAGHQVTVIGIYPPEALTLDRATDEIINGVRVIRLLPSQHLSARTRLIWERIRLTRALAHYHRRQPFDILEYPSSFGWTAFGTPRQVPTIVRLHGGRLFYDHELGRQRWRTMAWLEKRGILRADYRIAVSHYVGQQIAMRCHLPADAYQVIYNSVDSAFFSPGNLTDVEPGLIVFINRIVPQKGATELVQAMNHAAKSHPQARLAMVGRVENDYREYLTGLLEPQFRERVQFIGHLPREAAMLNTLHRAQVCVYPSHSEALGIAPLEAMACAKPTIFTRYGAGPEVIEDGISGLLCDPFNPDDLAHKIQAILDNPKLADALGRNARQRILQHFDQGQIIAQNLAFYAACI